MPRPAAARGAFALEGLRMHHFNSFSIHLHRGPAAIASFVVWLALFGAFVRPAAAQTTSGSIAGTVRDEQGASIPEATVTLTNLRRGTHQTQRTNRSGDFVFLTVPPDEY